jgi:hypothetical protein
MELEGEYQEAMKFCSPDNYSKANKVSANWPRDYLVLRQNGGFCNRCITERCLQNSRKVS